MLGLYKNNSHALYCNGFIPMLFFSRIILRSTQYLIDRKRDTGFSQICVDGDDGKRGLEAGQCRDQPLRAGVGINYHLMMRSQNILFDWN